MRYIQYSLNDVAVIKQRKVSDPVPVSSYFGADIEIFPNSRVYLVCATNALCYNIKMNRYFSYLLCVVIFSVDEGHMAILSFS